MSHLVLIDAMNLIRRLYAVQERPYLPLPDQLTEATQQQIITNTVQAVEKALLAIIQHCEPTHLLLVFDSQQTTWRHQLYPEYKANRSPMPALLMQALPELQQRIQQLGIAIYQQDGFEADDIIASLAQKMRQHQQEVTVVSTDKGYCPLLDNGVRLYDHFRRTWLDDSYVQQKFGVSAKRLIRYWSLVGDSTNHIPGVAGIGPKTALELLQLGETFSDIIQHPDCPKAIRSKLTEHKADIQCFLQLFQPRTDLELGLNLQQLRYPVTEAANA
ncbi:MULTISPECIES: flap endonuclease Xni [Alkalimonas]|uniref:Flap endonuclease Xni n=1 Tax=Alkalimonas mucilaginosa TaxID=3057676 RepID=A0ABU7JGP3_9GAMM|nr:flap endonuclease Xni [Alkalimonas sp. MEB004]MEE2024621.1 flap endonuclease Xni [Alkalimonas sp. MEB004]